MRKILFATSEVHPFIKTGGLADVSASLPAALAGLGEDVRVMLPGYRDALSAAGNIQTMASIPGTDGKAKLLETTLPGTSVTAWLLDYPPLFDRPGNPYLGPGGTPWPDNAERFAFFSRAVSDVAMGRIVPLWQPDVLHCNDWQCGLAPVLCARETQRPATVFTIHNIGYQGLFPQATFRSLNLPEELWSYDALEFYGKMSFIKGGIVFADRINTVSSTYAEEILTSKFGCGLEGALNFRRHRLHGILNGIDDREWNPEDDPFIEKNYGVSTLEQKQHNKRALQKEMMLVQDTHVALIGMIGRLVEQKGIDLVLEALPQVIGRAVQLVCLGTGDTGYERKLRGWSLRYPRQITVNIGFDERLSHRIEAGADIFLMPSRYEPCGLNQMYSQRYGTVPIVNNVGGLADTVKHASPAALDHRKATGVVFNTVSSKGLVEAVERALALFSNKDQWKQIQKTGMKQDFSWRRSAEHYQDLYSLALRDR